MNVVTMVIALAVFSLLGCDKKADECKRIVNIVNESTDKLGKPKVSADAGIEETTNELADLADKTAKSLAAVSVTTPELKKVVADYEVMARDISQASREMKGALSELNAASKGDHMQRAGRAKNDMTAATVKLVEYCAKKKDDECKKVKEGLPAEPKSGDDFVKIAKTAEAFRKLEWKDRSLSDLVATWSKAVADADAIAAEIQKLLEQSKNLEVKVSNAHLLLKRATQKSDGLTAELNKVCRP